MKRHFSAASFPAGPFIKLTVGTTRNQEFLREASHSCRTQETMNLRWKPSLIRRRSSECRPVIGIRNPSPLLLSNVQNCAININDKERHLSIFVWGAPYIYCSARHVVCEGRFNSHLALIMMFESQPLVLDHCCTTERVRYQFNEEWKACLAGWGMHQEPLFRMYTTLLFQVRYYALLRGVLRRLNLKVDSNAFLASRMPFSREAQHEWVSIPACIPV